MNRKTIHIINGPNLNLIGTREPEIYGKESLDEYIGGLQRKYSDLDIHSYQSNHEGGIIDYIHEHGFTANGLIINAGALSHYSYAIHDAIKSIRCPVVEVHISNIYNREAYRKASVTAAACKGVIAGFGLQSYEMAVQYFMS